MKQVLIVDDDAGILEALKAVLEEENYHGLFANDEPSLINILRHHHPCVMVLDLKLSGVMGDAIVRQLRLQKETKDMPIILMSADPRLLDVAQAVGVKEILRKPFDLTEFLEKISRYCQ